MEQVFQHNVEYIKQNQTSDIWSEDEILTVKSAVHVAWSNATHAGPHATQILQRLLVITNNQIFQQFAYAI